MLRFKVLKCNIFSGVLCKGRFKGHLEGEHGRKESSVSFKSRLVQLRMSITHSLHVKIQKTSRNYWLRSNLHNYEIHHDLQQMNKCTFNSTTKDSIIFFDSETVKNTTASLVSRQWWHRLNSSIFVVLEVLSLMMHIIWVNFTRTNISIENHNFNNFIKPRLMPQKSLKLQ